MDDYIKKEELLNAINQKYCASCDSYGGIRCRACRVDDIKGDIDHFEENLISENDTSWWNARYPNNFGEYEIKFASKDYKKTKAVEKVCCAIMDGIIKSPEDIEIAKR